MVVSYLIAGSVLAHMVKIETQRKKYCVKQQSLVAVSQGPAVGLSWHRMPVNSKQLACV